MLVSPVGIAGQARNDGFQQWRLSAMAAFSNGGFQQWRPCHCGLRAAILWIRESCYIQTMYVTALVFTINK